MSNYLSIAAVTEILKEAIADSVSSVVPGVTVSSLRPKDADTDPPAARVNLYLYQSIPNPAFRNNDLPTRAGNGDLRNKPQAVLDLDFILSFYGDHSLLEHQRLMGGVVTLLHAQPLLSAEFIEAVIQKILTNDPTHYLGNSDLAQQPESIRLTPITLNLEEMSKIWSVFFQVPHALSIAYRASAVFLEPDSAVPKPPLPVYERRIALEQFSGPLVEKVHPPGGQNTAILAGDDLSVIGTKLTPSVAGDTVHVRVDSVETTPSASAAGRVEFTLPSGLSAGQRAVRIVHKYLDGAVTRVRATSNPCPILLRPAISGQSTSGLSVDGDDLVTATLTLTLSPDVEAGQAVSLLLTGTGSTDGESYVIPSDPVTTASSTVGFSITNVLRGEYLMRVEVDGVQSLLSQDGGGDFNGPTVDLDAP